MNFLSNNKWPQEGISYTFQIPPNISIGRLKNHKMNWILVIFYHTSYAGAGCHRHNSVTIKNIIFSKIFYCLEIVSRFSQTMQSSGGWKLVRSQLLSRDIFPQTIKQHCISCENHKRHSRHRDHIHPYISQARTLHHMTEQLLHYFRQMINVLDQLLFRDIVLSEHLFKHLSQWIINLLTH